MSHEWYTFLKNDDLLHQGEIITDCDVFFPRIEADPSNNEMEEFLTKKENVIILSHSCDLQNLKKTVNQVLLCPFWPISQIEKTNAYLSSTIGKEECRRGMLPCLEMLNEYRGSEWSQEVSVVSFFDVYSLPIDYLQNLVSNRSIRPVLNSPYKEHIAQSFAKCYMRVGFPEGKGIQPFKSDSSQKVLSDILKNLNKLDSYEKQIICKKIAED
ncbi:MAG: hypothetical protein U5L00_18435 [Desulfovermiculus sp.]|nr:hypothetical protein [Desulfovermiculus sp.]